MDIIGPQNKYFVMKLCTSLVPLLVFALMTICDGLPKQFLNQFSCEDHTLDCNAGIEAGQPLSDLCTDLSLELSQTSADFGLLLYYQVRAEIVQFEFKYILLFFHSSHSHINATVPYHPLFSFSLDCH